MPTAPNSGVRTKALIDQYEQFSPCGAGRLHHVNGALTVGENIGDLGGLSIALLAYQISLKGKEAPVIDGLTGVQRVYFGWAQVWRTKSRDAEAIRRLAVDPHSPPEFRCNGVIRNIDSFYEAFEVADSDELHLEPAQRVRIWNKGRWACSPGRSGAALVDDVRHDEGSDADWFWDVIAAASRSRDHLREILGRLPKDAVYKFQDLLDFAAELQDERTGPAWARRV